MKVKECESCLYFSRRIWTQYYESKNYHPIGMTHAYGYCTKYKKRCVEVKSCKKGEDDK